ncbi:hypothetical protein TNCV_904981 [Trichonephila clavipes]|nr:hypothetical protein TNCV_904981 [Trichonephila clavipes]
MSEPNETSNLTEEVVDLGWFSKSGLFQEPGARKCPDKLDITRFKSQSLNPRGSVDLLRPCSKMSLNRH